MTVCGFLTVMILCTTLPALADDAQAGPFEAIIESHLIVVNQNLKQFIEMEIQSGYSKNETFYLKIKAHVKKNMGVLGMKNKGYVYNENLKKYVLTFNIVAKNLCQKSFISKMILAMVPGLTEDCGIKPNIYKLAILDFNTFIQSILNYRFFYGRYMVINELYAVGHGRFLKTNVTVKFVPKR